ncbi:MAG: hydroxyacid dehydrogenase [Candidatus Aegiribacteria sp.]|nr:hydroxyacid dehydrogenase [Candidatus Aegiribacteria sp.]
MIRVLFQGHWDRKGIDYLRENLDPSVQILTEENGMDDIEILISGRPDEALLARIPGIKVLIIPWAGLPESTGDLLKKYPAVHVHNIHHNAASASEMAVALMMAAARLLIPADRSLRNNDWSWRYNQDRAVLIERSRVLILGYGHVGSRAGAVCRAMGAKITGIQRIPSAPFSEEGIPLFSSERLSELLVKTDILIVALPLTSDTKGIIGKHELDLLHDRSIVVNVGRGQLIDEESLYYHLRNNLIGAAGIDVWYNYPSGKETVSDTSPSEYPFGTLDNIVMSPHMGGAFNHEELERQRMIHLAEFLNLYAAGEPLPNRIDLEQGY